VVGVTKKDAAYCRSNNYYLIFNKINRSRSDILVIIPDTPEFTAKDDNNINKKKSILVFFYCKGVQN